MTDIPLKSSDILLRGRDVIIERGHCKRRLSNDEGHVCARGALLVAVGAVRFNSEPGAWGLHNLWFQNAENYLLEHLGMEPSPWGVAPWNNAPERTVDDILDAFHEAALLAKEDGN